MYKVLIVDDEYYSRKGLIKIIPWKELNCEIVGEAENGYEALDKINQEKPDIVVSDINMPGLDGLELAEKVQTSLKPKFIIVTGYDDFNYAKRAVKVNAVDFIKKPINIEEFIEAIKKTVELIKKDNLYDVVIREKEYLQIMREQISFSEVYIGEVEARDVRVVIIKNDSYDKYLRAKEEGKNRQVINMIKDWSNKNFSKDTIVLSPHSNRIALVLDKSSDYDFKELIYEINNQNIGRITVGISNVDNEKNIHNLYKQAKERLEDSFLWGINSVITKKYPKKHIINKKHIKILINEIVENSIFMQRSLAQENLNILLQYLIDGGVKRPEFYECSIEICFRIRSELIKNAVEITGEESLECARDVKELKSFLQEFINNSIDYFREINGNKEDQVIKVLIQYINENYNKEISLKTLSKMVYLNENYLSRYFKQKMGVGFSIYIRDIRINKAKELLIKGEKITVVAKEVGYSDHRQFNINFRKVTGLLPTEYKDQNNYFIKNE
ncbi:response regulator [Clostridium gasigenes]|uniref:response regulator transcription factor n=1 Tax=Clostridium gasigenes TaxID=94869 RepID=UPI0014385877|nr:response regulator [Clostridium gasigenes]NKF08289.1 response regulator [Clostridium gasigenes]QSW20793.1 response regulator [Clostridium gasigenes]